MRLGLGIALLALLSICGYFSVEPQIAAYIDASWQRQVVFYAIIFATIAVAAILIVPHNGPRT